MARRRRRRNRTARRPDVLARQSELRRREEELERRRRLEWHDFLAEVDVQHGRREAERTEQRRRRDVPPGVVPGVRLMEQERLRRRLEHVRKANPRKVAGIAADRRLAFAGNLTDRERLRMEICNERKARREVLHALKRTGKGAKAPKSFDWRSRIKC